MYENRFHSEGTFYLGVNVLGYPAFVVGVRDLILKLSTLTSSLNTFHRLAGTMPYLNTLLVDALLKEIEASNEIEGIHSSRKDLLLAMSIPSNKHTRFAGQVRQYIKLLGSHQTFPKTINHIRNLYDGLFLEEIKKNDPSARIDGRIFRKDPVYIVDGLQVIHQGIWPEEKIVELLDQSLKVANDPNIPALIRIAVFHFLFGYIHPFYDGNGRMNRYLSSLFLTSEFSPEASLQLSLCMRKKKKEYYQAFKICEDPFNKGDLTPFVLFFLETMDMTVQEEIHILKARKKEYDLFIDTIHHLDLSKKETILLNLLAERKIFNLGGATIAELCEKMSVSENTMRKLLHNVDRYIYTIREGKTKQFGLHNDFLVMNQ